MSFGERFEQLKRFKEFFGFLFNLRQFGICCHQMHVLPCDNTAVIWNKYCPRELIVLALKRTSSKAFTALLLAVLVTLTVYRSL